MWMRLRLKEHDGPCSRYDGEIYKLTHNRKTGVMHFQSECGWHSFPATAFESILIEQDGKRS